MATWRKILQETPLAEDLATSPSADLILKTNGTTTSWATVESAATGTVSEVTVGTGLQVVNGTTTPTINLKFDELIDKTNAVDGSEDELLIIDNASAAPTVAKRKLFSEIRLSAFSVADSTGPSDGSEAIPTSGQVFSYVEGLPISTFTNDSGFEQNVQSNWNSVSGDAEILNKPSIPVDLTVDGAGTVHSNNYTDTTYSVGDGGLTTNDFTNDDHTKLDGIETSADVTDTTNGTAAGALMDSELTDLAGVKGVTIDHLQVKLSEGAFYDGDKTKLDGIEAGATVDQTQADINALAITTTGALDSGSITSGFTGINVGSGPITTTGILTGGNGVCQGTDWRHQEIHCWYSTTTAYFMPFGPSNVENAGVTDAYNDDTLYIAPYDGTLEKIVVQSATGVGFPAGDTDIGLRVNGTNGTAERQTLANETTATYTFTGSNTFSAGDRLRLKFDSAIAAKYVSATSIWKFSI